MPLFQGIPSLMNMNPDRNYHSMMKHVIPRETLLEVGFPLVEAPGNTMCINQSNYFGEADIEKQKCRCRKTFSLLNENWYCADDCYYHPLKIDKENFWRYKCCGRPFKSRGCISSMFHTSSYIPLGGDWYTTRKWATNSCRVFGLDCEFVYTQGGMEVACVSVMSLKREIVYHTYVVPNYPILDFNSQFSGITYEDFENPEYVKTLSQVQDDLISKYLSSDTILVGHGLHSDLKGLHICHENIIDTSILYPHIKGFPYRYSLEYLAQEYLGIRMNNRALGHSSTEDAHVSLQLALLKCGFDPIEEMCKLLALRYI